MMVGQIGGANGTQQVGAKVESTTPNRGVAVSAVQSVSKQNEQKKAEERELHPARELHQSLARHLIHPR